MIKRLQVLMDERELREIRRAAKVNCVPVSEWVRRALREARRRESSGDATAKLELIRKSAAASFPTAEIDQMLAEIELGYTKDSAG
jgi:hypothetical protein